jgi:penicillin-binding protein 2
VLPHVRGRINAINAEQFTLLRESGYNLNDVIGFFGLEQSFESILRGENGTVETTRDSKWEVISVETTKSVRAGNSVMMTIDTQFQDKIERILADHINWINQRKNNPRRVGHTQTTAGSIVVIDVNTGAILALASNPSYNLDDYVDLMLLEAAGKMPFETNPLLDRSIGHGYRPGSSFKTVTGAAGLLHGVVSRDSSIRCGGIYTRFADYRPRCHVFPSSHGAVNSTRALHTSCNVYYYDVGFMLGIDRFVEVSQLFGIGTNLNCDVPMFPGRMTTPEIYESLMGFPMSSGDLVQAAIGQSETLMTPVQMTVAAATVANGGVRLRPYLIDSVWNYDYTELIHRTQPQVVLDFREEGREAVEATQAGMKMRGDMDSDWFAGLPYRPAYKTGTPELFGGLHNSTVIGYYPPENPQIAYTIVIEGGDRASKSVRNIINAYHFGMFEPLPEDYSGGNFHVPWSGEPPKPVPGRIGNVNPWVTQPADDETASSDEESL